MTAPGQGKPGQRGMRLTIWGKRAAFRRERAHLRNLDKLVVVVMAVEEGLLPEHHACTNHRQWDVCSCCSHMQACSCFAAQQVNVTERVYACGLHNGASVPRSNPDFWKLNSGVMQDMCAWYTSNLVQIHPKPYGKRQNPKVSSILA